MTDYRSPPPPPDMCLVRSYASRGVLGGTLIAEAVTDLATHQRLLQSGGYRPPRCLRCGSPLHIHGDRSRLLLGSPVGSADVARFRCADRDRCGAVYLVLPAWIARHLWRTWKTVEESSRREEGEEQGPPPVSPRTAARWKARLAASAMAVIVALGSTELGDALATTVGLGGARHAMVSAYAVLARPAPRRGLLFASLAAVIHRAAPGIRLM